jgi:HAMP domain-containing protein
MTLVEVTALIVALAVVVAAVFLVTAVNNLNNTLAKLEDTAHQLRDEGIAAFRDLRQLVADADAELDKVDVVLDRADRATTQISETTRRTHEAVQDPMIRTLAVASGTGRVARAWLFGRSRRQRRAGSELGSLDPIALDGPDR